MRIVKSYMKLLSFANINVGLTLTSNRLLSKTAQDASSLKPAVINLYKNLIYLSKDWHYDLKPQIKGAFMKNKDVRDPDQIRALIDKGEYVCREITATYRLKKYRAMKRRYYSEGENKYLEDLFKSYQ